jgi:hypothetical protein
MAQTAHAGQTRKYTPLPYTAHTTEVADLIATRSWATENDVAIGHGHDIKEDCDKAIYTRDFLARELNPAVADGIGMLTNPSKDHPELTRAQRKAMDREHIAELPANIQAIKLIDRCCNLGNLLRDPVPVDFMVLYLEESKALYRVLTKGVALDPEMAQRFQSTVAALQKKIQLAQNSGEITH